MTTASVRRGSARPDTHTIRQRLRPIFEKYEVAKAVLFGSFARAEPDPHSDIDLIIVRRTDKRFLDRYDGIMQDLNDAFEGIAVEPLIYTGDELESMKNRPFISRAMAEGVVLYEHV